VKNTLLLVFLLILIPFSYSQQRLIVKPVNYKPVIHKYPVILPGTFISFSPFFVFDDGVSTPYPNIRVFSTNQNQSCISAAISPINSNYLFAGANTDFGMGYYYSSNGGLNWSGGDIIPGSTWYSTNPASAYSNTGTVHYNYYDDFMLSDRSPNGGINWAGRIAMPSSGVFDKNHNTIDQISSSPYNGRIYTAWTNFTPAQPVIVLSYSSDGGASYSNQQTIGQPLSGHYEQGCNLQTGPNGEIYCVWATPGLSNNIEDHIGFTKSLNGGLTWQTPSTPITIGGIRGTIFNPPIRVNSFPSMAIDRTGSSRNGYIYLVWTQRNLAPAGTDADICFAYSSNGGSSWSSAIRVNDDAINNGRNQFFPWITVDQSNGKISVAYYDCRDANTPDSCNTYLAVSNNGGTNFSNIRISNVAQKPVPIIGYADGYFGDYISVTALNDIVYPFWTDLRNGNAQVYTAKVILAPYFIHSPLKDNENLSGPYNLSTKIYTFGNTISSADAKIIWGIGGFTDSVTLTNSSGTNWTGSIPGNSSQSTYRYYLKAKDNLGRESKLPANAPATYFTFTTGSDVTKPVIIHQPNPDVSREQWPDSVAATVTDNTGIDSVWVKWYRNTSANGINQFRLQNAINDYFISAFNSTQSQVSYGDSIFYRVFARDNSSNHNIDSTALYKFKILTYTNVIIGYGTTLVPYPFRTFYTDSRTQILFTASELTAAGGHYGKITRILFNFGNASSTAMNNLSIKMQNSSLTSLTGFVNSGWTQTSIGTVTIPNPGWFAFYMGGTFVWNGTSNLLIEICFHNSNFGQNSAVYSTQSAGMTWHQAQDLITGSGCTDLNGGTLQSYRPNVVITTDYFIGVNNNSAEMPVKYSLIQNYPNPFNPVTSIKYSLPRSGFVSLKIYDVLGKEIIKLVNEYKQAGNYKVDFEASNISSGIYFYKLESANFSATKKMILIK